MCKYMKYKINLYLLLVIVTALISCESEYSKTVKNEVASGVVYDSVFLGINIGDTRKEFFEKCWKMNKEGIITNGAKSPMVQYDITDSAVHQESTNLNMLFYPLFDKNEIISGMECEFTYPGWSPWNERYTSDSLLVKVNEMMINWYKGNKFIKVEFSENENVYAKIDGNRRIVSKKLDHRYVSVVIHDISHPDHKPKGL